MIFGEELAGPIVQTILECLNAIRNFTAMNCASGSRAAQFLLYLLFLSRAGELRDNFNHYVDALGKRSHGDALVVAVHAF
jgi:hypothetical protein